MRNGHIMKDPDDLDVFTDVQVDLTNMLDATKAKRDKLINFAMNLVDASDKILIKSGFSLREWQRACYEAHQKAKTGDVVDRRLAQALWTVVQYIQSNTQMAMECAGDPETVKAFKEQGITIPAMPTDD